MSRDFPQRPVDRRGAAAVEFAFAATIFFFSLFACFEFGRVMMIESFAEQAAFRSARELAVLGATTEEGIQAANDELSLLGVSGASVIVEPLVGGVVQDDIQTATEQIRVVVQIPLNDNAALGVLFRDQVLEREAILNTERLQL